MDEQRTYRILTIAGDGIGPEIMVTTHCLMSVINMRAQAVATGSRALVRKVA